MHSPWTRSAMLLIVCTTIMYVLHGEIVRAVAILLLFTEDKNKSHRSRSFRGCFRIQFIKHLCVWGSAKEKIVDALRTWLNLKNLNTEYYRTFLSLYHRFHKTNLHFPPNYNVYITPISTLSNFFVSSTKVNNTCLNKVARNQSVLVVRFRGGLPYPRNSR